MTLSSCFRRSVVVATAIVMMAVPLSSQADETPARASDRPIPTAACRPADECCRVCSAGKACGNSCIQASKTCHKGRGCACNEAEICDGSSTP